MLIPAGSVVTYGQLAHLAGRPGAARWAGAVLRTLPEHSSLPWHRVVAAGGRIALPNEAGAEQRRRLEAEGVVFRGNKVSLNHLFESP
ncbi:MGMT family protein [Gilvimarinus agarilyticus]|nr:MGMT family protein [Gilvimarinus agarilyticus]